MQNNMTFTLPNGEFTTSDGVAMTVNSTSNCANGYWLNGVFHPVDPFLYSSSCVSWFPSPADNKTEKAFRVAKTLLANKRVTVTTPAAFIALVEELAAAL